MYAILSDGLRIFFVTAWAVDTGDTVYNLNFPNTFAFWWLCRRVSQHRGSSGSRRWCSKVLASSQQWIGLPQWGPGCGPLSQLCSCIWGQAGSWWWRHSWPNYCWLLLRRFCCANPDEDLAVLLVTDSSPTTFWPHAKSHPKELRNDEEKKWMMILCDVVLSLEQLVIKCNRRA